MANYKLYTQCTVFPPGRGIITGGRLHNGQRIIITKPTINNLKQNVYNLYMFRLKQGF